MPGVGSISCPSIPAWLSLLSYEDTEFVNQLDRAEVLISQKIQQLISLKEDIPCFLIPLEGFEPCIAQSRVEAQDVGGAVFTKRGDIVAVSRADLVDMLPPPVPKRDFETGAQATGCSHVFERLLLKLVIYLSHGFSFLHKKAP
ncbi:hypothetical protein TRIP_B350146 [uncultured Desulfatiglans sp.]|uniref:Uncharacterized protein n=1 Tax=Uncultured Desulfatiglans sp. TaxID=1748965 RepID=A0A653AAJ8_UNCDX|nr:hypothetical protein TRIP_B350146 [uncultured Desulfatiglans sp.]